MRSGSAALLSLLLVSTLVSAQRPPIHGVIGNSVVVLNGPWAFHPGDDMAWAQPGFDDSAWDTMDLTPPPNSYDFVLGSSGFVPGWTAKGYPNLSRYAWYRIRIDIENAATSAEHARLAIKMPESFDDVYQIFVNGQFIGEFGHFAPGNVTVYNAQPRAFLLPANVRDGMITIAIRMWMSPDTPLSGQDAGGLHGSPVLGRAASIEAMLQLGWLTVSRAETANFILVGVLFLAALLGFTLFWLDRREKAYLWLGFASLTHFLNSAINLFCYYTTVIPIVVQFMLVDVILSPLTFGMWVVFWGYWFGLDGMARIHRAAWTLVSLLVLCVAMLRAPLYGGVIPVSAAAWLLPVSIALKLMLGVLILWVVYRGIRTRGSEGWLVLPVALLMLLRLYADELLTIHVPTTFHFFGIVISVGVLALLLTFAVISLFMMRRFIGDLREREQMKLEMEQARQVQQVLIPEALPVMPGFAIGNDYRPAQQVGGDFFQILPLENGGLLAVVGDVSGKGMPAAMTVSLLVGTVRALVSYTTQSPGQLLAAMNLRMIGRSQGGFTTCLILRADPDGRVTVANAGHLSPYIQGKESQVAAGVPLGIDANASYPETTLHLASGQQITLLTDGVVEARSQTGELFGFERTAAISNQPAESIAETAQKFGQEDDITVLTLSRRAA
jgi:hypothetical protein